MIERMKEHAGKEHGKDLRREGSEMQFSRLFIKEM